MKPESQQIAIAKACGWLDIQDVPTGLMGYNDTIKPSSKIEDGWVTQTAGKRYYRIPNYLNDLNAMHEAEKALNEDQLYRYVLTELQQVCNLKQFMALSTAAQRAEAFLRTLGLWKESESTDTIHDTAQDSTQ